ncbi:MAG TPA: multiprotein bridging factor aMBF1 [Thermoplasmata archaeon]|nr:multiprotein bridging factor aMBF1 [Thermoplasmata archaeon]
MLCEMCGNEVETTSRTRIEGSVLRVCPACARFGTPVDPPPPSAPPVARPGSARSPAPVVRPAAGRATGPGRRLAERDLYEEIGELELASDWPKRVRVAREALGWAPEELAKKLNEKKSVVLKVEAGGFHPSDELVRKIEHLLKVRLRADPNDAAA